MNIIINGHNMFKILIVTFLCSICLVPLAKVVAKHIGAIDMPNERKVHKKPMPRLGGLAIYLTFLIGYMLFAPINDDFNSYWRIYNYYSWNM